VLGIYFPVLTNPFERKPGNSRAFLFSPGFLISAMPLQYFITYKPFEVLSRFSSEDGKQTLATYCKVPKDVYPIGRLDYDSEGLLILSNDAQLNQRLLHPSRQHVREYWVQVDGQITEGALKMLRAGMDINIDGKPYRTSPCQAYAFDVEPVVPERTPPIRFRKNIPTSWIRLILTEGKNRQVRKMTAKAGFPTLRLIRYRIEQIRLDGLNPGDCIALPRQKVYELLFGR
jgi:23S rRNA pseudouridine2457 synthase